MKRILYSLLSITIISLQVSSVCAQTLVGDQRIENNLKETTLSLYPLPTNGILHIGFNKTMNSAPNVLVYDMIGNVVERISPDRESIGSFSINLSGKPAGYYFIKVQTEEESFSRRITVTP